MSEVSGDDDVGAALGFLYRVLHLEMHQLRRDDRPHHCQQPSKEFGRTRGADRCSRVNRNIESLKFQSRAEDKGRESVSNIDCLSNVL